MNIIKEAATFKRVEGTRNDLDEALLPEEEVTLSGDLMVRSAKLHHGY